MENTVYEHHPGRPASIYFRTPLSTVCSSSPRTRRAIELGASDVLTVLTISVLKRLYVFTP